MMKNKQLFLLVMLLLAALFMFNMLLYYKNADFIKVNAMSASAVTVMDVNSNRVLLAQNEHTQMAMASTTKIMTAIVAIEESDNLDEMVQINDGAVGIEGTSIYLRKGEKMPLRELLYGLMLASGNDASMAIGYHIGGGDLQAFVDMMNKKAEELGSKNTHFINTHGLDANGHYTTAYDLALIAAYAQKNADYAQIAGTKKRQITSTPEGHNRFLLNKQRLLKSYEWCVGGKTGFTDNAGRCSVSAAKKDGLEVVCVVLNAPNMFEDSEQAFNSVFNIYKRVELLKPYSYVDSVAVEGGRQDKVKLYTEKGFSYPLKEREIDNIKIEKELPELLTSPLKKEQPVGKIKIYLGKDLIFCENIYTIESVENLDINEKIKDIIKRWFYD
jgi:serine-type D-Ala-D-Ala carboxypeptidase (penicillin-binding protein 5/6)